MTRSATSLRRSVSPFAFSIVTWAKSVVVMAGKTCLTLKRWLGPSMNPPVPTSPASDQETRLPTSRFFAVCSWSEVSETLWARNRCGSACTWYWWRRSPQMGTFATPGTRSNRALIFQYATRDMSIRDSSSDVSPIFMTLLVEERGWIMKGGDDQLGRVGETLATRSCTTCRACRRLVPRSKSSWIDESWGNDLERIVSSPGTPWSACSRGTVIRDSTSSDDSPVLMVWISTLGWAN